MAPPRALDHRTDRLTWRAVAQALTDEGYTTRGGRPWRPPQRSAQPAPSPSAATPPTNRPNMAPPPTTPPTATADIVPSQHTPDPNPRQRPRHRHRPYGASDCPSRLSPQQVMVSSLEIAHE